MKRWTGFFKWTGLLSLVFVLCAFPAFAQETEKSGCSKEGSACSGSCGSSCGDGVKACAGGGGCSKTGNDVMAAIANCGICKNIFQNVDLLTGCDHSVSDWSQGVVFSVSVKNPKLLDTFRAFEKNEKKLGEKYKAMDCEAQAKSLCPACVQYFAFLKKGLKEERIETPTGTLTLVKSECPKLLAEVHAWSARMRKDMTSFDMSQFSSSASVPVPAKAADVIGTPSGPAKAVPAKAVSTPKKAKSSGC